MAIRDPSPLTTGSGNFVASDGVTATYSRVAGETVAGNPYHITATLSATVPGALDNYTITNSGADFTINKRLVTWTTQPASKTYGDADPNPLTTGSGSNFIASDGVTATYNRVAGETVAGNPYHITATLSATVPGALDNYTIANAGADFTINKRLATWTTQPASKTYGDTDPNPLTTGSGSNFIAGDGVTATYSRVAGETVAGNPHHITATLTAAVAGALNNYDITNLGANFTINRRLATWTTQPASKTYGDVDPNPLTTGAGSNFIASDGVTATYTRAPGETVLGSPYAIYPTLGPVEVLNNYTITNNGAIFSITPAPLAVVAANKTIIQGGVVQPLLGTIVGLKNDDNITATFVSNTDGLTPGSFAITPVLTDPNSRLSNYAVYVTNGVLTVTLNAPPVILEPLDAPIDPMQLGSSSMLKVTFTDIDVPESQDYTITVDWGNGTAPVTRVVTNPGTESFTYVYPTVGVYRVTVTVSDKITGNTDSAIHEYIVIYDPNGGFVTGGGWIWSPAGAYAANLALSGKANFGFVSKYQKGKTVPTGNTEFQFQTGNLNFKSTEYEWLVISGINKAQFRGTGTINGSGEYDFILTAIDGDGGGEKKPDAFRIRIVDRSVGGVIYDNKMNSPETGEDATVLGDAGKGGGSITIHSK